jgi:Cytochrome c oxidase subunit IV
MKSEYKLFGVVTAFLFAACALYAWWSAHDLGGPGGRGASGPDYVGVLGLALSGLLCLMCGSYFWFVSRRIDLRPEDRDDSEIADGAGEIGFFSPGSYWPVGLAGATVLTGIGLVYLYWWLIALGLVVVILGTGGLLFEYYTGARKAH